MSAVSSSTSPRGGASIDLQNKYAADVDEHSTIGKNQSIYPGVNFRHLALFLNKQTPPAVAGFRGRQFALGNRSTSLAAGCRSRIRYSFLVVHSFSSGNKTEVTEYAVEDEAQILNQLCKLPKSRPGSGQLVFMRGFGSASWLKAMGAQYRVDPEFFRRHLNFLYAKDYHDLPTLPSNGCNIVQLRLVDVFARGLPLTRDQIRETRQRSIEAVRNYQKGLGLDGTVGESIIRRLLVLDETFYAVEYNISLYIKASQQRGWTVIVWIDIGRNLSEGPLGTWLDQNASPWQGGGTTCVPIFQHQPKLALTHNKNKHQPGNELDQVTGVDNSNLFQSVSLFPSQYGATLNPEIASKDILYGLKEIFVFAANSENQFLNLVNKQIDAETGASSAVNMDSIANLKYTNALLDEHILSIENTLLVLKTWDDNFPGNLPNPAADDVHNRDGQATRATLVTDFDYLCGLAKTLSRRCIDAIGTIANDSQLEEARKAMQQAERSTKLTLLAFVYLPLSLAASIFGMNVTELGTGSRSAWAVVVATVAISLITTCLYFWDRLRYHVWIKHRLG